MENQHRKIVGYRELSQEDITLMNEIKAAGKVLLDLQERVTERLQVKLEELVSEHQGYPDTDPAQWVVQEALDRLHAAEPQRWAAIAKTDLQTGVMALVRAVAQPTDC